MGRYNTQVVYTDGTAHTQWTCQQTSLQTQGTCVLQLTGGLGGTGTCGPGSGVSCQWNVPAGVSSVVIEIWGGGGGGGSAVMCQCDTIGNGGGGGAYARKTLAVTAGTCYTICVGAGGAGGGLGTLLSNATSATCCCGASGGTTYITGTGLANLCAEGGYGGESRISSMTTVSPNGGWAGTGGDVNVRGSDGGSYNDTYLNRYTWGGSSPFGGRNIYLAYDCASKYQDLCCTGRAGGICGYYGVFPGGGGTGGFASCCCIGIAPCGGNGAPGAIRIWM